MARMKDTKPSVQINRGNVPQAADPLDQPPDQGQVTRRADLTAHP